MKLKSGLIVLMLSLCWGGACFGEAESSPNIVLIFTDDQGYGDLSCFGSTEVATPRIDRMAAEGMRLTSFYVPAPVCTPSRAGLMTGCYPKRVSMATGSDFVVLLDGDPKGLNPSEITIAEILKTRGYATGIFGKWHLGDQAEFLPTRQGFDEYYGIPYSHDIHPFHPKQDHFQFPALPFFDGETVIEMDPDADFLTKRLTDRAVDFIERHKEEPFFLYLPHPIPHRPLHVSPESFEKVSGSIADRIEAEPEGSIDYEARDELFEQAIAEIDWSVGQILDALKAQGLDEDTLVIFTSDNGPAVGSAGPLRGRKGSTFEGGMREATVVRWPGRIAAGTESDELLTSMDLLPTLARLAGGAAPSDRAIDGKDIWPVLLGVEGARSPHEAFFYHRQNSLMAIRSGKWKYHRPTNNFAGGLFNLETDIGETEDVSAGHPRTLARLKGLMADFESELGVGNDLSGACRSPGWVESPVLLTVDGPRAVQRSKSQ